MFFVTGDTHCPIDMHKLSKSSFNDDGLSKDDFMIICGDAGFVWGNRLPTDNWWQNWMNKKKYTTLCLDGNHENHAKLDALPTEIWNGGKIHRLKDSVIYLMRGQVYTINGIKFFTMGGASSIDKMSRTENKTWWAREMPSKEEYEEAISNLDKVNWKVDFVITHTAPSKILNQLGFNYKVDELSNFFNYISENLQFNHWYFGHLHTDKTIEGKFTCLFDSITNL